MRWLIVTLLFLATMINYLDRGILGVILPEIRQKFSISTGHYGNIQFWFQIAYGAGSLICGGILDRFGTRIGYALAAGVWSLTATLNGFAASALQFGLFRTVLGLGESANFPACNKAAAEWFPPNQRATVMGLINMGTNFAQVVGPPLFIWMALTLGWQACFIIMGLLGFVWLPFWLFIYKDPKKETAALEAPKLPISAILKYKQAWGYGLGKFLTDAPWWFYLFWLPTYLTDVRHFDPTSRGNALSLVYAISGAGAIVGGVFSSSLMKKGWHVGKARKTAMLVFALIMPLGSLGVVVGDGWAWSSLAWLPVWASPVVFLFGLATFAHQAWMSNLFTTPSDVFPKEAVGSANGFGVALGAWGGAQFSALIPGAVIPVFGYVPVLLSLSFFYLIAWVIVHKLMGNLEQVRLLRPVPVLA